MDSLYRNAQLLPMQRAADVELLMAVDSDDEPTKELAAKLADRVYTHHPRLGYSRLHEYVNPMAMEAEGEWLWLFNDDATVTTSGWDVTLLRERPSGVLDPETNHPPEHAGLMTFPIVHRSVVEAMGHFSRSNHCDTYMQVIADALGLRRPVGIEVFHDRPDITGRAPDQTSMESAASYRTVEFYGAEMQAAIREDVAKVKAHLGL